MLQQVATTVTFPIRNRMYGVNALAKHLNSLVVSGDLTSWHPGRWVDETHRELRIDFESSKDARFAETLRGEW